MEAHVGETFGPFARESKPHSNSWQAVTKKRARPDARSLHTQTLTHKHTRGSPRDQADLDLIRDYCTGYASTAFNSLYVVPSRVAPFDYETGDVSFSNESTSPYNNGTHMVTIENIENPCYKESPKQILYCQLGSQMSLLVCSHPLHSPSSCSCAHTRVHIWNPVESVVL